MIIDLTADMYERAPAMPGDPQMSISKHSDIAAHGFALSRVCFGSHQGTHIDAPSHIIEGGKTLSDFDAQRFAARSIKIDLSHISAKGEIDIADLLPYESEIKPGMGIVIHTGWDKHIGKKQYFADAPRITPALATWLAGKSLGLLGIDMPCPNTTDWQNVHKILLGADILIVEGLVNLDALSCAPFMLYALPLKLLGADGSPVRAIAVVD